MATTKKAPLLATVLAKLGDDLYTAREQRLAADKVAAELKAKEQQLESKLIELMRANKLSACGGTLARYEIAQTPELVPAVKDWQAFYAYIAKNKAWDLLERRPGKAACRARWEDGKAIPGVEQHEIYKLSRHVVK